MNDMTEATARELIESIRDLSTILRGLTAVLIEDREVEDEAEEAPARQTYLDGSPR